MASLSLAAIAPRTAAAQQLTAARVGWVAAESRPEALNPFRQALKELGWVEGGNLTIEQRYAHGLLKQAVPSLARLAVLEDHTALRLVPMEMRQGDRWEAIETAARQLGIQLTPSREVRKPDDLDGAFALAAKDRAGGVLVLASAFFSSQASRIVSLAAKTRLPAIYEHQGFVERGGLMSYGASHRDTFRRIAGYVDRVLKGAKPADLPVEQPTKLDLALNLRTAKTLGLTIPQPLLLRVDQVVQ